MTQLFSGPALTGQAVRGNLIVGRLIEILNGGDKTMLKPTFKQTEEEKQKERLNYREYVNTEAIKALVRLNGLFQMG
jgi:hypothetical protein